MAAAMAVLLAAGAVGAEASDQRASADATGAWNVFDDAIVVEHLDGDLVVLRVGHHHDGGHDGQHVSGKGTAEGNGPVVHDGFTTYADATALAGYEIRLVSSSGIEQLRPHIVRAAHAAVAAGAPSLQVAPGTVAAGSAPARGQIHVTVSSNAPCRGSWLGCGGPIIQDGVVVAGQMWINPRLLTRDESLIDNTSRHELGHTLGLGHYDELHEGRIQTMHGRSFDASGYEAGDRRGFRFVSGDDGPDPGSTPPPGSAAAATPRAAPNRDPSGVVELAGSGPFGVVVRGWAADPDATVPVSVLVTVGGAPTETLADRGRADGSTTGFEVALPVPPGSYEVCVLIRNSGSGADTSLGCRPVMVSSRSIGRLGVQTV